MKYVLFRHPVLKRRRHKDEFRLHTETIA
jgi:hypothetical protein